MPNQQEYVLRTVEERGIRFIRLWFTDVLGSLKSFAITPADLETAFDEGMHFDGSAIDGFSRAEEDSGVRFRRTDLQGSAEIPATIAHVVETDRGTTLGAGDVRVRTVEHVLAAVAALRIDNLAISVDGPEVPILDGSFAEFVAALESAGPVAQEAEARVMKPSVPDRAATSVSSMPSASSMSLIANVPGV